MTVLAGTILLPSACVILGLFAFSVVAEAFIGIWRQHVRVRN